MRYWVSLNVGTLLGGSRAPKELRPRCQPRTTGEEVKFQSVVEPAKAHAPALGTRGEGDGIGTNTNSSVGRESFLAFKIACMCVEGSNRISKWAYSRPSRHQGPGQGNSLLFQCPSTRTTSAR